MLSNNHLLALFTHSVHTCMLESRAFIELLLYWHMSVSMLSHVLTQPARCVRSEFCDARSALCEEHHVLPAMQRASAAQ